MILYLDASAVAKRYVAEPSLAKVEALIGWAQCASKRPFRLADVNALNYRPATSEPVTIGSRARLPRT